MKDDFEKPMGRIEYSLADGRAGDIGRELSQTIKDAIPQSAKAFIREHRVACWLAASIAIAALAPAHSADPNLRRILRRRGRRVITDVIEDI